MLPNFKKAERQSTPPVTQASVPKSFVTGGDRTPSLIGPEIKITGNLISKGELRVDGDIEGDIRGVRLVIGEQARVTGNVAAEDVIVLGHVMGSVRGLHVSLQSTSQVHGDVYHQALVMEQGAVFQGRSVRAADPLAPQVHEVEQTIAAESDGAGGPGRI